VSFRVILCRIGFFHEPERSTIHTKEHEQHSHQIPPAITESFRTRSLPKLKASLLWYEGCLIHPCKAQTDGRANAEAAHSLDQRHIRRYSQNLRARVLTADLVRRYAGLSRFDARAATLEAAEAVRNANGSDAAQLYFQYWETGGDEAVTDDSSYTTKQTKER
jgi:hypothetical protein